MAPAVSGVNRERLAAAVSRTAEKALLLERAPVTELATQNAAIKARWAPLLQEKYRRMAESPFAFFRGSDGLFMRDMARLDPTLARQPRALLQGDMHLGNLGTLPMQDGSLRYGLVDFDEAAAGPIMLDLRRLATSVRLVSDERGFAGREAEALIEKLAKAYHHRLEAHVAGQAGTLKPAKPIAELLEDAAGRDPIKWLDKQTTREGGLLRMARGANTQEVSATTRADLVEAFEAYKASLPVGTARQLTSYRVTDAVVALNGVGSLGRGRYRVLVEAPRREPMIFDLKEQLPSAIDAVVPGGPRFPNQAERTRRLLVQANPGFDATLGVTHLPRRNALAEDAFLVRRLVPSHDAVDLARFDKPKQLADFLESVGAHVADLHVGGARNGLADASTLLAQLGKRKGFARDLAAFGKRYARQVRADHQAFVKALEHDPLLALPKVRARA